MAYPSCSKTDRTNDDIAFISTDSITDTMSDNSPVHPNQLNQVVYTQTSTDAPIPIYLAQADQPSPLVSFLPIVFILLIFYFLLIRPQSKKQKALDKKRKLLEKGDKIITTSGMYVKVVDLDKEKDLMTVTPDGQVKIEMTITAVAEVIVSDEVFKKREDKDKEKK